MLKHNRSETVDLKELLYSDVFYAIDISQKNHTHLNSNSNNFYKNLTLDQNYTYQTLEQELGLYDTISIITAKLIKKEVDFLKPQYPQNKEPEK